jgi:hypothetical protein
LRFCQGTTDLRGDFFAAIVPNLDLTLYNATTGFVVGSVLASSVSTVDNVELIYFTGLAPGQYALGVSSDTIGTDYGLAWVATVPEPGSTSLLALGGLGLAVRLLAHRRRG